MQAFLQQFGSSLQTISFLIMLATVFLHILFAAGVAKDIGNMQKRNILPMILPGFAWVLTALITGILGVLAYWFVHHSSLARK